MRVPIRWDGVGDDYDFDFDRAARTPPYTIDPRFFQRIDSVVSWARQSRLVLVLNDHHHDSLFQNFEHEAPRFLAIWAQIAERYKNLPTDSVGFEILNEPNTQVTAERWNVLLDTALKIIRQTNPTRPVVIGTAEWGGPSAMERLKVPADSNLILTIHDYAPFTFTHQGANWVTPAIPVGAKWGGYWDLRQATEEIERIAEFAKSKGLPVWIGEFGALPGADSLSRFAWAATKARLYEKHGFAWAWWEFKASFGVYRPGSKKWNNGLVNALLSTDTSVLVLPAIPQSDSDVALNGQFVSDTGWEINLPQGKATFTADSGTGLVVVDSATPGTSWGVQLVQAPLTLRKGYSYVLLYSASADTDISIDATVGMNEDPWGNYGSAGHKLGKTTKSFYLAFQGLANDTNARICFNVGNTNGRIRFDSVRLLEYAPPATPVRKTLREAIGFRVRDGLLSREGADRPKSKFVIDVRGAKVARLDWQRQNGAWVANLSSVPTNRVLLLDQEPVRLFLRD